MRYGRLTQAILVCLIVLELTACAGARRQMIQDRVRGNDHGGFVDVDD